MDDKLTEMQYLGFFGILRESFKIIVKRMNILSQISASLILPFIFQLLSETVLLHLLFMKVINNNLYLDPYSKLPRSPSSGRTLLLHFSLVIFFISLGIFSVLSNSSVVYSVACIITCREISFKKVMGVVPEVWKRLINTFLCVILFYLVYYCLSIVVLYLIVVLLILSRSSRWTVMGAAFLFLSVYQAGLIYISTIWQLSSVVSVLEDASGTKALQRSRKLLKGKMAVATIIFLTPYILCAIIQFAFQKVVFHGGMLGTTRRLVYGWICLWLIFSIFLIQLVIRTVLYFVCKSHHRQNIDKTTLLDHLDVNMEEYVALKSEGDVPFEHLLFDV